MGIQISKLGSRKHTLPRVVKRGGWVVLGIGKTWLWKVYVDEVHRGSLLNSRKSIQWSGPKRVAVISHHFWSAGTMMQRSEDGLLSSLLCGIVTELLLDVVPNNMARKVVKDGHG